MKCLPYPLFFSCKCISKARLLIAIYWEVAEELGILQVNSGQKQKAWLSPIQVRLSSAGQDTQTEPITHPSCAQHCNVNRANKRAQGKRRQITSPNKNYDSGLFLKTHREGHKPGLKILGHFLPFAFFYPTKTTKRERHYC